jgi:hypothetical protein
MSKDEMSKTNTNKMLKVLTQAKFVETSNNDLNAEEIGDSDHTPQISPFEVNYLPFEYSLLSKGEESQEGKVLPKYLSVGNDSSVPVATDTTNEISQKKEPD